MALDPKQSVLAPALQNALPVWSAFEGHPSNAQVQRREWQAWHEGLQALLGLMGRCPPVQQVIQKFGTQAQPTLALDTHALEFDSHNREQVMQQRVVGQIAGADDQQAVGLRRQGHAQHLAIGMGITLQHGQEPRAPLSTRLPDGQSGAFGKGWQGFIPRRKGAAVDQVKCRCDVLFQPGQEWRQPEATKAQAGGFVDALERQVPFALDAASGIGDGPGNCGKGDTVLGKDKRKAQLIRGVAQRCKVRWRLHVFSYHQAGLHESLDVATLLRGSGGDTETCSHEQVSLPEPFGGIGEFADVGPANGSIKTGSSAHQSRAKCR
ncbi:hypothetical protein A9G05_23875 [Pseudomonas sp. ENNP23]|nr:hypothetical protein A9G05_23875 [Pseudomonas sp. ENNP23]